MDCDIARESISASIDGEAQGVDQAALLRHRSHCGACGRYGKWAEILNKNLREAIVDEPDTEPLWQKISAALDAEILRTMPPPKAGFASMGSDVFRPFLRQTRLGNRPRRDSTNGSQLMGDASMTDKHEDSVDLPLCMRRRDFLAASAAGAAATAVAPNLASAATGDMVDHYPELPVVKLEALKEGEPVAFNYPLEEQPNMIVKLGTPAQGGVGPDKDIVAFSVLCTHMGGSLRGRYKHEFKSMGPCPFHFSTFDLTKGGVPVHASATQNLPQVELRVEGDQIIAVGMNGLVYGYRANLADGTAVVGKG